MREDSDRDKAGKRVLFQFMALLRFQVPVFNFLFDVFKQTAYPEQAADYQVGSEEEAFDGPFFPVSDPSFFYIVQGAGVFMMVIMQLPADPWIDGEWS